MRINFILVGILVVFAVLVVTKQAPDNFRVKFSLSTGRTAYLNVTRSWSPLGVDRFYELLQAGYYNDNGFFRGARKLVYKIYTVLILHKKCHLVVPGFVVQFGIK